MDGDHAFANLQPERIGDGGVEHFGDLLDLKVVVARSERPHLLALAPAGVVRDRGRVGVGGAAALLDALKIARPPVALLESPPGIARQHGGHAGLIERDLAGGADADRDGAKQRLRQVPLMLENARTGQAGQMRAHAAGDVEADAARRHNSILLGVERGNAADREAVAPVGVGHGVGSAHDARQRGDVDGLLL
jgi:hypothetical protein